MMNWVESSTACVCLSGEGVGTGRSVRAAVGSNAGRRAGASGMIAGIRIVEI